MIPSKIISGGQTGADRAALDAALELGVAIGGWVPKGRKAEDGPVADHYTGLQETESGHYETRTRYNVRDADATLIITHGELHGGSRYARDEAESQDKPWLHVDLDEWSKENAVLAIRSWLSRLDVKTLNIAGPRESSDPGIYKATRDIVRIILKKQDGS
jgi:hypothetical protein